MNTSIIIGSIIGLLGLIVGIYYGRKNIQLYKELRRITWDELRIASRELQKKIKREFQPDIIFTPCRRGATIANLMFDVDENIHLYVGIRIKKREEESPSLPNYWKKGWEIAETGRYYHYIPINLLNLNKDMKMLILDDFAMTGDSLKEIVDILKEKGFKEENIKTATIVCTYAAYEGKRLPDFYWHKTEYKEFYFPWGKAI